MTWKQDLLTGIFWLALRAQKSKISNTALLVSRCRCLTCSPPECLQTAVSWSHGISCLLFRGKPPHHVFVLSGRPRHHVFCSFSNFITEVLKFLLGKRWELLPKGLIFLVPLPLLFRFLEQEVNAIYQSPVVALPWFRFRTRENMQLELGEVLSGVVKWP